MWGLFIMHISFTSSTFKNCIGHTDASIFFSFPFAIGYAEFDNCLFIGNSDLNYD